MGVAIVPDAETLAILKLKALESIAVPFDVAFNAMPRDYQHAAWWYREMGIDRTKFAARHLDELRAVGATLALSTLDVTERSICVKKHLEPEGSGENKG